MPLVLPRSVRFHNILLLLREAFISLLPIVLVMNILVLLSGLTQWLASLGLIDGGILNGDEMNRLYFFMIPLFLNLSLSLLLARDKELDQIGTLLISMVCFLRLSGFVRVTDQGDLISAHSSILISIPITLGSVALLAFFSQWPQLRLAKPRSELSPRLQKTLNLIIPGLLTVLCCEVLGHSIHWIGGVLIALGGQILPRFGSLDPAPELTLFKLLSQLTWFLGVHGELNADGLFRFLNDIPAGEPSGIRLKTFHDAFMNIGGSGSTFVIPFILLCSSKTRAFRSIAQLSLPFAFFNVNELLLFGLPIILNPLFLIPFLLVPFINMVLAGVLLQWTGVSLTSETIHWMSPPIYSAYHASYGAWEAVAIQIVCLLVDAAIYYPFLVKAAHKYQTSFDLGKLFGRDAYALLGDEITQREERRFYVLQRESLHNIEVAHETLQGLKGGEFLLFFQPKVDAMTLELVGLEGLLRFRDAKGAIVPPTFLPILYQQGLSKKIDQTVVGLAFEQILEWRLEGYDVPQLSLNFDKEFLLDTQAVSQFLMRAKQHNISFGIEITEHTYTTELRLLSWVIQQMRAAGHHIAIDDFGAGYSSLTSLVAMKVDEIKLDRQLLLPPQGEHQRGFTLLRASVQLCHDLGFSVVAEGIEDKMQLHRVQACGVDCVQGFYTGRPMNAKQVCQLFPKQVMRSAPSVQD